MDRTGKENGPPEGLAKKKPARGGGGGGGASTEGTATLLNASVDGVRRKPWDTKGSLTDERNRVRLLRAKLDQKVAELDDAHRRLREATQTVASFETMSEDLYARLEAKQSECRQLSSENAAHTEELDLLSSRHDALQAEHEALLESSRTLAQRILDRKREQVDDTIQLYMASLPSTLHKYRFVDLKNRLDAVFTDTPALEPHAAAALQ